MRRGQGVWPGPPRARGRAEFEPRPRAQSPRFRPLSRAHRPPARGAPALPCAASAAFPGAPLGGAVAPDGLRLGSGAVSRERSGREGLCFAPKP